MRRARAGAVRVVALAAALAIAGCPLPQPVASVAGQDGTTQVTPPRFVTGSAKPTQTVVPVNATCTSPSFTLSIDVEDLDTSEQIEARWFVDYDPPDKVGLERPADFIPGPDDPSVTIRSLPPFTYNVNTGSPVHVVEVVVSNGFAPPTSSPVPYPNRMPADGYETQVFRWVFQIVTDGSGSCSGP